MGGAIAPAGRAARPLSAVGPWVPSPSGHGPTGDRCSPLRSWRGPSHGPCPCAAARAASAVRRGGPFEAPVRGAVASPALQASAPTAPGRASERSNGKRLVPVDPSCES